MNFGALNIQDPNVWQTQQNLMPPQGLPMAMPQPQAPQMMPRAPMPMQQPMQMPQITAGTSNPSPHGPIGDVLNQLIATKQQQEQQGPTMAQQILAMRFQPTRDDDINANVQNNLSLLAPNSFKSTSPFEQTQQRTTMQLAPYTTSLDLQGKQADVVLKQAQANQANALSQMFTGGPSPFGGGGQPANGQIQFNPRGAMMAKAMGLPEGMQIGMNGQPEQIPGMITPGQKEQDTNFAQAWQTYSNTGGAARTADAINVVDGVINQLKSGQFKTGADDMGSRMAWNVDKNEPSQYGVIMNPTMLAARTKVASAILPQAKALFGSRVTNFDAQTIVNSKGIDPIADTATNIQKLEQLKSELLSGQQDLQTSGQYFQQHGTLAGYQPQIQMQNAPNVPPQIMQGVANSPAGSRLPSAFNGALPPPPAGFQIVQ